MAAPAGSLAADSIKKPVAEVKGIKFNHVFRISSISRKYSDAGSDAGFYANNYSGTKGTSDSVRFLSWTNRISLLTDTVHLGKFPLLFSGGLSPDMYRYLRADTVNVGIALGINGKVTTEGKTSRAEITAAWTAAGYSAGDYSLDATFTLLPGEKEKKPQVTLELFTRGCSPDPTIRDYKSAHFRWRNDFLRQREAGLNIRMDMPGIKTSLVAAIATDKNRIYFDTLGLPAQLTGRLTVYSLKATKEFKAGPFRSSVRALVQYSTSGEIRLPLFTGSTSTYMHHDIHFKSTGGEIQVEYGLDLNFNTAFYGYAYMPATGAFFLENEKELGNYPYLNIFAQMKVKRTRVFVAWCQTLADMMPAESFAVLHYPSMRPHLKYGIYWHFYD